MIPEIFKQADLRSVTAFSRESEHIGLGFDVKDEAGEPVRLQLSKLHALALVRWILGSIYELEATQGSQSDISRGSPSSPVLNPPGQGLALTDKSSATCCGVQAEPSLSDSKKDAQPPSQGRM